MADIVKFGTLYLDDKPQIADIEYNGEGTLSIRSTANRNPLRWIRWRNLLISDRVVCTNISWDRLDEMGLIYGTGAIINGDRYICRSLNVSTSPGPPNEWNAAMRDVGDDNDIWHWQGNMTFGQARREMNTKTPIRGFESPWHMSYISTEVGDPHVGWRPVLEALGNPLGNLKPLLGQQVKLWGPKLEIISGTLASFDDYDIVLKEPIGALTGFHWTAENDANIIIERTSLMGIGEFSKL